MSRYEILTLLISVLAAVISAYSLFRSYRISQRQTELQQTQADLAAFQHKLLVRDQQAKAKADIRAQLVPGPQSSFKLYVRNVGASVARNVRLEPTNQTGVEDALTRTDISDVFPVSELRSGEEVSLRLFTHLGTRWPLQAIFTWDDESGENQQREMRVSP